MSLIELIALKNQVVSLGHNVSILGMGRNALFVRVRSECRRRAGYVDRDTGLGCLSSDGAYLDGWHDSDGSLYYISRALVDEVRRLCGS